jgi:hypothetical protein
VSLARPKFIDWHAKEGYVQFGWTAVFMQRNSYSVDSDAQQLIQELVVLSSNDKGYSLHDGLIRFKGKTWVGNNLALQTKLIQAFHSSLVGDILAFRPQDRGCRDISIGKASKL